jgi:hypothetical protein
MGYTLWQGKTNVASWEILRIFWASWVGKSSNMAGKTPSIRINCSNVTMAAMTVHHLPTKCDEFHSEVSLYQSVATTKWIETSN